MPKQKYKKKMTKHTQHIKNCKLKMQKKHLNELTKHSSVPIKAKKVKAKKKKEFDEAANKLKKLDANSKLLKELTAKANKTSGSGRSQALPSCLIVFTIIMVAFFV